MNTSNKEPTVGEFYVLLKELGLAGGERSDPSPNPAADISGMVGETVLGVETEVNDGGEIVEVYLITDAAVWRLYHERDCCESVYLNDTDGELAALIGGRIVAAEAASNINPDAFESETWTFYKLATDAGVYVTMRWIGSSNGYYSEEVYVQRWTPEAMSKRPSRYDLYRFHLPTLKKHWRQYGGGKSA